MEMKKVVTEATSWEENNESNNFNDNPGDHDSSKVGLLCENQSNDIVEAEETDTHNYEDAEDVYDEELDCTEPYIDNFKCPVCGFIARGEDELKLHVAEVHLEFELNIFVSKMIPDNECIVKNCGKIFESDYEKKEHVSLQHTWPTLASVVKEAYSKVLVETNISKTDVVTKIIELKGEQSKKYEATRYQCNQCKKSWNKKSALKFRISLHICSKHHKAELYEIINLYFSDKVCTWPECGAILGSKEAMKKHLIGYHKYFDDIIAKDMDQILGNRGVKPEKLHKRKIKSVRKHSAIKIQEDETSLQFLKNTRNKTEDANLAENDDIERIQQQIEFSDSEDEV